MYTFNTNANNTVREEMLDGKPFLVVPVVAVKEGVLNGIFTPLQAIAKSLPAWNGRPVSIGHPKANGQYTTANHPIIEESTVTGRLYNVHMDGDAMKGEVWVDVGKAERMGGEAWETVQRFQQNEMVEVSTGYFGDESGPGGIWNGKKYRSTITNILPDHLALLPHEVGACSIKDGCGAPRVNQQELNMMDEGLTKAVMSYLGMPPDPQKVAGLAEMLGVDPAMLMGGTPEMEQEMTPVTPEENAKAGLMKPKATEGAGSNDYAPALKRMVDALKSVFSNTSEEEVTEQEQVATETEQDEPVTNTLTPCEQAAQETQAIVQANVDTDTIVNALTETIAPLMREIAELKGEVTQLKNNQQQAEQNEREAVIATIQANTAMTQEELAPLSLPALQKLVQTLAPANYALTNPPVMQANQKGVEVAMPMRGKVYG